MMETDAEAELNPESRVYLPNMKRLITTKAILNSASIRVHTQGRQEGEARARTRVEWTLIIYSDRVNSKSEPDEREITPSRAITALKDIEQELIREQVEHGAQYSSVTNGNLGGAQGQVTSHTSKSHFKAG